MSVDKIVVTGRAGFLGGFVLASWKVAKRERLLADHKDK